MSRVSGNNNIVVVSEYLDVLARRRKRGEVSGLYSELDEIGTIIGQLHDEASPDYRPRLTRLATKCGILLRSIAH